MAKGERGGDGTGVLRRRAEERIGAGPGDEHRLVHELQVHQIELELQHEELVRARAETEEGLARYTDLYELAPVGFLTLDRNGTIRQLNVTGARLWGLAPSKAVGRRLGALVTADQRPLLDGFLARVFAGGDKESCALELRAEGAPLRVVELTASATESGQECRVAATDITERKRAEEALRVAKERLALAQRSAGAGMWDWDVPTGKLRWSEELFELFGLEKAEEPTFELWRTALHPQDLAGAEARIAEAIEGRIQLSSEYRIAKADGEERWILALGDTVYDAAGRPLRMSGICLDITERKWIENALRESERKYRSLYTSMSEGVAMHELICDAAGKAIDYVVTDVNPAFEAITGLRRSEAVGRRASELYGTGEPPYLEIYARVVETGQPARFETEFAPMRKWFAVSAFSFAAGRFATVFADITERVRTAREHEALRVKLAQSDRLAITGMLAAGVAHEVNNPLAYVIYNVESLAEDLPRLADGMRRCRAALIARFGADGVSRALGPDHDLLDPAAADDLVDRLREALDGAERIKRITRSLSTFSRVERTEAAPVDVRTSIENALTMASNEIKYRARVVRDFGDAPTVLASDGQLAQVVLNLLVNAAHAIDEGDAEHNEIRVRTWAEGDWVFIEVSDTGRGIAPEHRDRIFEPFFTTKDVGFGSGLGLSVCRNIVASFGGEIGLAGEPGEETRFRIRLPRVPSDWGGAAAGPEERAPATALVRGRILVVDDEAGIRASLVRILGADHEVIAAASGQEARELLETDRRFDLVLCDLMMPKLSGMELHRWIAQADPTLADQIVFITGGAFTPGAAKYLAEVENLRLEKPFDAAHIRRLAAELVLAARGKRGG